MKPLELKMRAFGSYLKPVILDFEKNLRGEKIFLIHGATGAGKTTILDAICYALYGTTSGDERDGVMMRSKGIPDNIRTEIKFSFKLGEKIYTVYRTMNHKGDKTAELTCGKDVIETKSTAVTKRIKELLGFDVKQFRQVVLLPQGEFKKFLFAKADERQIVLDALFNAEFYRRIAERLEKKLKTFDAEYQKLKAQSETLEFQLQGAKIDDAAIEKLRADFENAKIKSVELDRIAKAAQEALTTGKILAQDFFELERRNKAVTVAEENFKIAEKNFTAMKAEYDLREGEQSQREKLKSEIDKLAEIKKSLDDLESKRNAFLQAEETLQAADSKVKDYESKDKKYKERLGEIKNRCDELTGAEKIFVEAKQNLDRACEQERLLQEIARLEKELTTAKKKISDAKNFFNEAQLKINRLRELQINGSAARLAAQLKDGEPCPVCGSKIHYHIDFSKEIIPSDAEIDAAQVQANNLQKNLDDIRQKAATIDGNISSKRDELKKYVGVPTKKDAQKNFDEAKKNAEELENCRDRIKKGEEYIKKNETALEDARDKYKEADGIKNQRFGELQTTEKLIPKNYSEKAQLLDADILKAKKKLQEKEKAWKIADKNYHDAENKKSSCAATFESARDAQKELADKLKDVTPPEISKLKAHAEDSQKNYEAAIREENSFGNTLKQYENLSLQLAELDKKIAAVEKNLLIWKKLSDVASGKFRGNKISFVRWYFRAMFEQVLTEANYRLEKMSDKRYYLKQKDEGKRTDSTAGLNMEILDDYTGETRPVATLSGGESFLASLSLALGLAAVVRNNLGGIKLDTIFIDEGFGTLDSETLDFAIKTLIDLQSGGRLVGIISHVEELKNQIPIRLEVRKTKTGSTAEFKSAS